MPTSDERYEVRNAEIERALRTIGVLIDGEVPEGWGWGLFLVPFGDNKAEPVGKGAVFWISNSERQGMIDAIKGWIEYRDKRKQ
jgi:hypothetical protein